jgi:hypothetical protein
MVVRYLDPEPNGLAGMLGGLIEGNLKAHPDRARLVIQGKHATYSVVATDVAMAASIRFSPKGVAVRNGVVGRPDVMIETDTDTMLALSTVPLRFGLPDPVSAEGRDVDRKLFKRELRVRGLLRHPWKLARLNRVMSIT